MGELANLIFVGCFIAKCGPPGFQCMWAHLQKALWHFWYVRDDTHEEQPAAASSMWAYAKALEQFILKGEVHCIPYSPSVGLAYGLAEDNLLCHVAVPDITDSSILIGQLINLPA